jgi:regulator of sigma E protease
MSIETILAFVFVLGVVVVVHEAGHFLVAKSVGVYCKVFSVGFGPKLLKKRIGETEYAISAIPFGGYVKMAGEGAMEQVQDAGTGATNEIPLDVDADGRPIPEHRWFSSKTTWQRLAVVLAGPVMNLVLALVITIGVVAVQGVTVTPVTTIGEVVEDSPAAEAGLLSGDHVLRVEDQDVHTWQDVVMGILDAHESTGGPVRVVVERAGEERTVSLVPRSADSGRFEIGMVYQPSNRVGKVKQGGPAWNAGLRRGDVIVAIEGEAVTSYGQIAEIVNRSIDVPLHVEWLRDGERMSATMTPLAAEVPVSLQEVQTVGRIYYEEYNEQQGVSPIEAVQLGSAWTWRMVEQTAGFLGALVTGKASGDAVSGPIRIAQFSGEMVRWGFDRLLLFIAMFSVNLFLLNLLPVPVLDGGHVVFIVYEMIARRRPNERVQMWATQVGFVMLLLLMAWVLTMDVIKVVG